MSIEKSIVEGMTLGAPRPPRSVSDAEPTPAISAFIERLESVIPTLGGVWILRSGRSGGPTSVAEVPYWKGRPTPDWEREELFSIFEAHWLALGKQFRMSQHPEDHGLSEKEWILLKEAVGGYGSPCIRQAVLAVIKLKEGKI